MLQKVLRWIPAFLWYRVIWGFSAQSADISGSLSDRLLWRLMDLLSPAFSAGDLQVQNTAVELMSFVERKAAHMFLYFMLVILLWLGIAPLVHSRRCQKAASAVLCAILASLDECHQLLVPGRSGQVRDVFIDLAGAAIALALYELLRWIVRRRQSDRPFFPAWLSVGLCVLMMAVIVFPYATVAFLPLAQGSVAPGTVAPVLRECCFLAVCGLLGFCAALSAALSGLPLHAALGCALLAAVLPSGGAALLPNTAIFSSAIALTLLGCVFFLCLWLACLWLFRCPVKSSGQTDNAQP